MWKKMQRGERNRTAARGKRTELGWAGLPCWEGATQGRECLDESTQ